MNNSEAPKDEDGNKSKICFATLEPVELENWITIEQKHEIDMLELLKFSSQTRVIFKHYITETGLSQENQKASINQQTDRVLLPSNRIASGAIIINIHNWTWYIISTGFFRFKLVCDITNCAIVQRSPLSQEKCLLMNQVKTNNYFPPVITAGSIQHACYRTRIILNGTGVCYICLTLQTRQEGPK